jgi:hypothetical protein
MSSRRWLVVTIATSLAAVALVVGINGALDIYGLFRDRTGRALPVYGNERVAKYLLSRRYVRANFDGVLIGSSVSSNLRVGTMRSARLYNESVNGGNIVEEKALLDQVLEDGAPRLALLVVHPFLTESHESNSVTLTPREIWGALGSLNLLDAYKNMLKIRLHREPQLFDAAGTQDFGDAPKKLNARLSALLQGTSDFEIDPVALQAFRDVVAELHARHVPLGFVIPPTEESLLAPKREAFRKYVALLLADRAPQDRVLDFSADEFAPFRADPANFSDGVHLRVAGAGTVTAILDDRLRTWIADGWLNQTPREVGPPRTAELIEKLLQIGATAAHTVEVAASRQAPGR